MAYGGVAISPLAVSCVVIPSVRGDTTLFLNDTLKGLGKYQYTILLPIFGPSLAVPQSQNPRHNTIMPAVLFNRYSQI